MFKLLFRDWLGEEWHPGEGQLQRFVDGELDARKAARTREHLDHCWQCRVRAAEIQETIARVVAYLNNAVAPSLPPPPNAWRGFDAKLNKVTSERGDTSLLRQLVVAVGRRVEFRASALRFSIGISLFALLLLVFFRFQKPPLVSASQLLRNVTESESEMIRRVAQPVIYQKLRVQRGVRAGAPTARPSAVEVANWELWNDRHSRRIREQSLKPTLVAELEGIFRQNHMDPRQPMSPAEYEAWRKSSGIRREEVSRGESSRDEETLMLTTVAANAAQQGDIIEAGLVVRAHDWHPIEQYLVVKDAGGETEYQLAELAYEVVSIGVLGPRFFSEQPATAVVAPSREPILPAAPSLSELAGTEVEVLYALHRQQADLGEPIEVLRNPKAGRIEVRGLAGSEERKSELLAALKSIPHVSADLQTTAEAISMNKSEAPKLPRSQEQGPGEVVRGKPPLQEALVKYFSSPSAAEEFSNLVLAQSEGAMSEAWALRRLAERYPSQELRALRPSSKRLVEIMVREHVQALVERTDRLQAMLRPVLTAVSNEANEPASNAEMRSAWPGFAVQVFGLVQTADRLTSRLFGEVSEQMPETGSCISELLATLDSLKAQLPSLEKRISDDFLDKVP